MHLNEHRNLYLSLDSAFLLRYGHSSISFSCRFLLVPLSALVAGPPFGVGFGWYRSSCTFEDCVTVRGCDVKLASTLGRFINEHATIHLCTYVDPYLGSFCSRVRAGEFGGIFSIFTGCVLTQER